MLNTLYDCEQCGQPYPYVCDKCKEALHLEDVEVSEPKKYIGSGEDLDLTMLVTQ